MLFYKINARLATGYTDPEEEKGTYSPFYAELCEAIFQESDYSEICFTCGIRKKTASFGVAVREKGNERILFEKFRKQFPLEIESYKTEEITINSFAFMVSGAFTYELIRDDDDILFRLGLSDVTDHRCPLRFGEAMIDEKTCIEDCRNVAKKYLFCDTLLPELDRIEMGGKRKCFSGHPVHYMLQTDDKEVRKKIYKALLSALYQNGRLKNLRYTFLDFSPRSRTPGEELDQLYKLNDGGAVVIRFERGEEGDSPYARKSTSITEQVCKVAEKYKHRVLTLICLPKAAGKEKKEFYAGLSGISCVELMENIAFGEQAISYLKARAKEERVRSNRALLSYVEEGKGYTAADLNRFFDHWFSEKLKNDVYPQYRSTRKAQEQVKDAAPVGSAYSALEKMIGLGEAKSVIQTALDYFKAQKLFRDRGMIADHPSMHMVFTGNPGTAKTTVARLFARIMKENGILSTGEFIEVGRAELVGKYVGSTAPLVKCAFERARGGVLFIDEAYSLVDDRDGSFGDEAINAIVQEMENNREDTLVIFAGYPDKMEGFLQKNPGLRSRVAFHVAFGDYSAQELCEIARLIAEEKGLFLSPDTCEKLLSLFSEARKQKDFGNGRYARNVIEKAKMAMASRLMKTDVDKLADRELCILTPEDVIVPAATTKCESKIGFSFEVAS